MPSITLRRRKYWIQYYLPGCPHPIRQSLGVEDRAQAERMSDKLGNMLALLDPSLSDVELPPEILATLPSSVGLIAPVVSPAVCPNDSPTSSPIAHAANIEIAVRGYYSHILESNNDARWVSMKIKVLRVLFGDRLVSKATELTFTRMVPEKGLFHGDLLEKIPNDVMIKMVADRKGRDGAKPASTKTKRHYREILHDFFEYCLSNSIMPVLNSHTPNPIAALPTYLENNKSIRFLDEEQIIAQQDVLPAHVCDPTGI